MKGIHSPIEFGERRYLEELEACLIADEIIGKKSRNLANKLIGNPFFTSIDECNEGIQVDGLDALANKIFEKFPLREKLSIKPTTSAWLDFQKSIFSIPEYFRHWNEAKYFKFLSKDDQRAVSGFVDRKLNELDLMINAVHNFCVYVWHDDPADIRIAIVQIDIEKRIANYTFFLPIDGQWSLRTVQTTNREAGRFEFANNTLFLDLVEENESHKQLHAALILNISEVLFYRQKFIKGFITASAQNASIPTAWTIVMERKDSYTDAYKTATLVDPVKREIFIDILGRKREVRETNLFSLDNLPTARVSHVVQRAAGTYVFGFLTSIPREGLTHWTKGICYLYDNDVYISQMENSPIIYGKVSTETFYGRNIICLSNNFKDGQDSYKYHYTLNIVEDKASSSVHLEGTYCGVNNLMPRGGEIIFIPKLEYKSFDEIDKKLCGLIDINKDAEGDNLKIKEFLLSSRYFISSKNTDSPQKG